MALINGTTAGETLTGAESNDQIYGNGGGDVIDALGGEDVIYLGDGTDLVDAGDGRDFVNTEGGGDDVIHLGAGDDTVQVLSEGVDQERTVTLYGGTGVDSFLLNDTGYLTTFNIDAGEGDDEIRLQSFAAATIDGGDGNDTIFQFMGADVRITFGSGHDTLFLNRQAWAGEVLDTILDFQVSGASSDRLDLTQFLIYSPMGAAAYTANPFATGDLRLVQSGGDTLVQALSDGSYATVVVLTGVDASTLTAAAFGGLDPHGSGPSAGADLVGGSDGDWLYGGVFDDDIQGGGGDDHLEGGGGFDRLDGQGGDDRIEGVGLDGQVLLGGDGDDDLTFAYWLSAHFSADHAVLLDGGAGRDYLLLDASLGTGGHAVGATLTGGDGNDVLNVSGTVAGVVMEGGDGDDVVAPAYASGRFDGGAGTDTLSFDREGAVTFDLSIAGDQQIHAGATGTFINFEKVRGSYEGDVLSGAATADDIDGDDGNDVLHGAGGADLLKGGDGDDALYGDAGIDRLVGGAGNDLFDGGTGGESSLLQDGAGDVADFSAAAFSVTVDLSNLAAQNTGEGLDRFVGVEVVWGGQAADVLTGDDYANRLVGNDGNDHLNGGGGDDVLFGGRGSDVIDGGAGTDIVGLSTSTGTVDLGAGTVITAYGLDETLISIEGVLGSNGADLLIGSAGDNILMGAGGDDVLRGRLGDDVLDGGGGVDTADFSDAAGAVIVDLNLAGAQDTGVGRDTLIAIENVTGAGGDDQLTGDASANVLDGGAGQDWLIANGGADVLKGGDGHDSLWGGAGDDVLDGGAGSDTLSGGEGRDTASYASATSAVRVDLTQMEDQNTGGGGVDTLVSIENITGSDFADVLIGDAHDNIITGGKTTWVGGGSDPSRFQGDVMTGGGGNDIFVFSGPADADTLMVDRITDFSAGDRIDFSGVDLDIYASGRQGLHFGQTAGAIGDITIFHYDTVTAVFVVTDAHSSVGMTIYLAGWVDLTAADFIL